jgi:hypothetical protein
VTTEVPEYNQIQGIDETVLASLDNISNLYKEYLNKGDYANVADTANSAFEMLDKIAETLDTNTSIHSRIVALGEYWRLNRDLYKSRSRF